VKKPSQTSSPARKERFTAYVTDELSEESLREIKSTLAGKSPYHLFDICLIRKKISKPVSKVSWSCSSPGTIGAFSGGIWSALPVLSDIEKLVSEALKRESNIPRYSGSLDAYVYYIQIRPHWRCEKCDALMDGSAEAHEGKASFSLWATRQAKLAIKSGWYVPPIPRTAKFVPFCLCPSCAAMRGLVINREES